MCNELSKKSPVAVETSFRYLCEDGLRPETGLSFGLLCFLCGVQLTLDGWTLTALCPCGSGSFLMGSWMPLGAPVLLSPGLGGRCLA